MTIRVLVWNENIHERNQEDIRAIYPGGIHGAIAVGLKELLGDDVSITTATLADPEHGLDEATVTDTDVMLWWGHVAHDDVTDDVVDRLQRAVLGGLGLIVLHSGHFSKLFIRLMGTTCSLAWRNDGGRETVWTTAPGHPIAEGIEHPFVIERQEMYGEHFDIPNPDDQIFISSFDGGEVFRSGVTFTRGLGRIFYFSPGDQEYPVYFHPQVRRVLANAVKWTAPATGRRRTPQVTNSPRRSG